MPGLQGLNGISSPGISNVEILRAKWFKTMVVISEQMNKFHGKDICYQKWDWLVLIGLFWSYRFVLTGHFIRNTIVILCKLCTLCTLCSQSNLRWPPHILTADLSAAHSSFDSSFLPHPSGALLGSDPVTGETASQNQFETSRTLWHGTVIVL